MTKRSITELIRVTQGITEEKMKNSFTAVFLKIAMIKVCFQRKVILLVPPKHSILLLYNNLRKMPTESCQKTIFPKMLQKTNHNKTKTILLNCTTIKMISKKRP